MIVISQIRKRCIGCNYCVELAPQRWKMSKKDGKSVLLGAIDKKGFFTVRVTATELESNLRAAQACPVNIIKISEV